MFILIGCLFVNYNALQVVFRWQKLGAEFNSIILSSFSNQP